MKYFSRNFAHDDQWINQGSVWIVELIEPQYIRISTYRPFSGGSFLKLPAELRSSKKGLINIKNNDQKCFLWCHIGNINPVKIHPERTKHNDKKLANDLDYSGIVFPVQEKDFSKIEKTIIFALMAFVTKIKWFFQSTFQIENLKTWWICCL